MTNRMCVLVILSRNVCSMFNIWFCCILILIKRQHISVCNEQHVWATSAQLKINEQLHTENYSIIIIKQIRTKLRQNIHYNVSMVNPLWMSLKFNEKLNILSEVLYKTIWKNSKYFKSVQWLNKNVQKTCNTDSFFKLCRNSNH